VPLAAAGYERDAIGLQVGLAETELRGVLFAYEVTYDVIDEAKERGANLIVAFHPLIFPTIAAVTNATRTGALIRELVKSDIALYVLHTALDTHPQFGTSRLMAIGLMLSDVTPLRAMPNRPGYGMGASGFLSNPYRWTELLERVSRAFAIPVVRHNDGGLPLIHKVALVGGAGMDYYSDALKAGAQAFITADVRYHDFYRADHDGILLIDAGHAETERFVVDGMLAAGRIALIEATKFVNLQEGIPAMRKESPTIQEDFPASRLFAAQSEPNSVRYFLRKEETLSRKRGGKT
jgi:dinuclear metal center YbgI/SA1388 family protein